MSYLQTIGIVPGIWFAIASLTPTGMAQSATVSPLENTFREGNSASLDPFGTGATPFRWLQVHDDVTGPALIQSLSFREDGWGSVPANGFTYVMRLSEAPATVGAASIHPTFMGNHGANFVQHFNRTGSFTAVPYVPGQPMPQPAVMTLVLPVPYALGAGQRLVWDIQIQTRQGWSGPTILDAVWGADGGAVLGWSFGTGCPRGPQLPPATHTMGVGVHWANQTMSVVLNAGNAPPNGLALFWIGVKPFLPALALGTSGPSGPCFLHVSPLFTDILGTADAGGNVSVNLGTNPLPAVPLNLYSQAFIFAPGANQLGWVSSNGHLGYVAPPVYAPPPVGVLQQAMLNTPVTAPNSGLVVTFR